MDLATVSSITTTAKGDADRSPVDVVRLEWEGRSYYWNSEPGTYTVDQQVRIDPPVSPGLNITPAQ